MNTSTVIANIARTLTRRLRPGGWSLRTRLGAVATIAATIGLCLAGLAAYAVTSKVLHEQIDDSLRNAPTDISGDSPRRPDMDQLCRAMNSSTARTPALFTIMILRPDGTTCSDADAVKVDLATVDLSDRARPEDGDPVTLQDAKLSNGRSARLAVISLSDDSTVLVARDSTSVQTVLNTLRVTLFFVVLIGALGVLGLSRRISRLGLRPITQFAQIAEDIAETGNLQKHVLPQSPVVVAHPGDELARLAHAFNTMTAVLADEWSRQRRLVADAGHELRTPLASVRSNIGLLRRARSQDRPLAAADEVRLLADLDGQIVELTQLVDDLVELSAEESGPVTELVRLDRCAELALQRARRRTGSHHFSVALDPFTVRGNASALERAIVNLLDNAIKFSPPGSTIEMRLADGQLTISDRGPGIEPDEQALVFDRFWRSPRARALPGSGLGLSIVSDVAGRHGGVATLTSREGGGAVATLRLPEASATERSAHP